MADGNSITEDSTAATAIATALRVGFISGLSKVLDFMGDLPEDMGEADGTH